MVAVVGLLPLVFFCSVFTSSGYPLEDKPILFPGERRFEPHPGERRQNFEPPVDKNGNLICGNSSFNGFCDYLPNYPVEAIRQLITTDAFKNTIGVFSSGIGGRKSITPDDLSEESVCGHRSQPFLPKAAKNSEDKWRYVINDVNYVQTVVAEVCKSEGKPCSHFQDSIASGFSSVCRQRFSMKRLLAIDPDKKKTYMDSFKFPSCCSCYVKSLFDRKRKEPRESLVRSHHPR